MYCNICGKKLKKEKLICRECEKKRAKYINDKNKTTVNIDTKEKEINNRPEVKLQCENNTNNLQRIFKIIFILSLIPYFYIFIRIIYESIKGTCIGFLSCEYVTGIYAIPSVVFNLVMYIMFVFPYNVLAIIIIIFQVIYVTKIMKENERKKFINILKTIILIISYIPPIYILKDPKDILSLAFEGIEEAIMTIQALAFFTLPTIAYNIYYFKSIRKKNITKIEYLKH